METHGLYSTAYMECQGVEEMGRQGKLLTRKAVNNEMPLLTDPCLY